MLNPLLLPLLSTLALYPSPSLAAAINPRDDCRSDLSCTFTQLAAMTMSTRLDYIKSMQSGFFGPLNANNQFAAIEGVIQFFINNNLGAPESWASYVDAGIVEGIQNGGAIALGLRTDNGSNPGTEPWKRFFRTMEGGGYVSRDVSAPRRFCGRRLI
jgi:hypothetical protein